MTAGEGGEAGAGRSQAGRSLQGLACGLAAYGLWGLIPLYFRAVRHVPPLEMLAHRAAWSLALLAVVAGISGQWRKVRDGLRGPKAVLMLGLSTAMLSVNWLTFIYAVATAQVLQASLGYFITPLVNVLLGVLVLGERLRLGAGPVVDRHVVPRLEQARDQRTAHVADADPADSVSAGGAFHDFLSLDSQRR